MSKHLTRILRNLVLEAVVALPAVLASPSVHDYLSKHSVTATIVGVIGAAVEILVTAKTPAGAGA